MISPLFGRFARNLVCICISPRRSARALINIGCINVWTASFPTCTSSTIGLIATFDTIASDWWWRRTLNTQLLVNISIVGPFKSTAGAVFKQIACFLWTRRLRSITIWLKRNTHKFTSYHISKFTKSQAQTRCANNWQTAPKRKSFRATVQRRTLIATYWQFMRTSKGSSMSPTTDTN